MKTSIYYLHRGDNIPFYIGKSKRHKHREYEHKTSNDVNVFMEVIDEVFTSEWQFWERHYVSLFKSWGFKLENKNNGGGGPTSHKLSSKNLISKKLIGVNNWSKGGYHKKSVLQYDLDGNFIQRYTSVKEAEEKYNISSIQFCCRNQSKTAAGYIWFFEDNFTNELLKEKIYKSKINKNKNKLKTKEHSLKIKAAVTETNKKKRKPILQYDLDGNFIKEWEYILQASNELGLQPTGISNNIAGRIKYCGKWIWKLK
jgi:hypothetical protein